jgi:cytochrome P450
MLEMITEHKYTGADSRHDLLSSMIDASNEEAGDALTDSELMGKPTALLCRVNS